MSGVELSIDPAFIAPPVDDWSKWLDWASKLPASSDKSSGRAWR